jgi:hypothetical protein
VSKYLAIGAGVLAVLLVASGILLKMAWAENGKLEVKLAAANAVIAQKESDARLSADIVARQADALAKLETKVVTVTERIYSAPVTRECAASPSMRAASDGVRAIIAPAGGADPGRQPAPAVR